MAVVLVSEGEPGRPPPLPLQGVQSLESLRFRLVDAKGQVVGRLASQIATILQVRSRPSPHPCCGRVCSTLQQLHAAHLLPAPMC